MLTADEIYQELRGLPEPIAREVLDFAKYLKQKNEQESLLLAQEAGMKTLWDNEEDNVWDDVPTR